MAATVTIPIAGFKDVYDVATVEKALHELPPGASGWGSSGRKAGGGQS